MRNQGIILPINGEPDKRNLPRKKNEKNFSLKEGFRGFRDNI
jgi:hypothetical protein